jgi:glycosyltransferase involved in cell wall biosynthesis
MSRRDFDKYACVRCDRLMTVGAELTARVRSWTSKPLSVFQEGFCDEEFHPPLPWSNEFPQNILIMGSEAPGKGFTDFIQALDQVEMRYPDFPALNCDFTGATPVNAEKLLGAPRRSRFRFLGRVDGFSQLVRGYRLAVHPSRAETFGMAPIEGILAGVPVLVSETGAVSGLGIPSAWSFPPARPDLLAERLAGLWRHWETSRFEFGKLQERIRQSYHIDLTASSLRQTLASLEGKA